MIGPENRSVARLGERALFTTLEQKAYLAHSAISPPSDPVAAAVIDLIQRMASKGADSFPFALEIRERLRDRLATLIGAGSRDTIGLVQNTGAGVAAIATSLALKKGDRLLVFSGEYPTNVVPFQAAASRSGSEIQFLDAADYLADEQAALSRLEEELQRGVRLCAVSTVQFQTGLRMPVAAMTELCHRYGALISLDAVQSLGAVPFNLQEVPVDFLACGGHKWLMGIEGVGFLYVAPQHIESLQPLMVGNMSFEGGRLMLGGHLDELRYDRELLPSAGLFEGGMLAGLSIAALDASLALIEELGVDKIFDHIQSYHDAIEPGLVQLGFASVRSPLTSQRSGILSFRPPTGVHAGELSRGLSQRSIVASSPDGLLRIAPHWPNSLDEVPVVVEACRGALADLR